MDNKKKQVKKEAIKDINLCINDKNEVIIDNNVNKTVAENIKAIKVINSRKITKFWNYDYAVIFKGTKNTNTTIINHFDLR